MKAQLIQLIEAYASAQVSQNEILKNYAASALRDLLNQVDVVPTQAVPEQPQEAAPKPATEVATQAAAEAEAQAAVDPAVACEAATQGGAA